ncbi:acyltransferase-domain-containing protein [Schizophyllum amplum]|uniref:Tafazzin family protein n=1 Tax=Schizophyllum amplum TaxID=97359 RepID=A0A550CUK9_9AGAR|nr:acyltransferase-domain-containing protein [Auriculariopsis ampla]
MLTVAAVGLTCKAFLRSGLCSLSVDGLHHLQAALEAQPRRGVVTVSNHISTLDDPVTWGVLPLPYLFNSRLMRWTLGASDIMFTNPVFSYFFRNGQVLETFRGKGIYQPSVDTAIAKLDRGDWIHLFGEGKVNQPDTYAVLDGVARLPRFRWGVGRILQEVRAPPIIIPMWLNGFNKLMPEGRPFPYKYIPRAGQELSVTFGAPLAADKMDRIERLRAAEDDNRSAITSILRDAVEELGYRVSGPSLGGAETWKDGLP